MIIHMAEKEQIFGLNYPKYGKIVTIHWLSLRIKKASICGNRMGVLQTIKG
ncbi:hypothetical protein LG307_16670 [Sutcliffiella horikoshii]|uniref:hypothetical protein n=1 Tax=Sutcliffiella horikoshii TaxID=79883 RepID=UPI00384B5832